MEPRRGSVSKPTQIFFVSAEINGIFIRFKLTDSRNRGRQGASTKREYTKAQSMPQVRLLEARRRLA